ncbi:hypothetical protein PCANC_12949 [Puccinia coronata f. sp. avenae]|uniref:Reverse transcriptase Ty1/copia-type domain-containing protein n=1 Tax=Puccinia coronata f. sp. avenae TaxID=200324 RepID=A0A2N5UN73_9BASI|nr:hypothetical protein PCANC_12949 [Puccinia coronata f. sp. avenae]
MSSTESEMNALSDGEQESQWLKFLVEELWKKKLEPTLFSIDNKGLLEKLKNFGSNSKTKHLDIKIKSLRDKFKKKEIDVELMSSDNMIADALTKAAPHSSIKKLQDNCLTALSSSNKEGCLDVAGIKPASTHLVVGSLDSTSHRLRFSHQVSRSSRLKTFKI